MIVPATLTNGRKVKSAAEHAIDAAERHEGVKDYLAPNEMAKLREAAKAGRQGVRDHLLLLMTYRHGLRVSEAVGLRRNEVHLDRARLWVRRLKGGLAVEQPIAGDELLAIKRHLANQADALAWLFISERSQPLTRHAVNHLVAAAAGRAGLPGVHPHTLGISVASSCPTRGMICASCAETDGTLVFTRALSCCWFDGHAA